MKIIMRTCFIVFILSITSCTSLVTQEAVNGNSLPQAASENTATPRILDTPTLSPIQTAPPTATSIPTLTLTFTPSPTHEPVTVSPVNIQNMTLLRNIAGDTSFRFLSEVMISPDGRYIAVPSENLLILDGNTYEPLHNFGQAANPAWSADGGLLAFTLEDGKAIEIWNMDAQEKVSELEGHTDGVLALALSPDGSQLASLGKDSHLIVWDVATGSQKAVQAVPVDLELLENMDSMPKLNWSADGAHLAIAGIDPIVRVWDGNTIRELKGFYNRFVDDARWSPDGSLLAASSQSEPQVIVWRVSNWNKIATMQNHKYWIANVDWSPDGKTLLTADAAGTVFVRNPKGGAIRKYYTQFDADTQVGWSPDGSKFAALGYELGIYDLASGEEIAAPEDLLPGIAYFAWVPGSQKIILVNWDHRVQLWDTETGKTEMILNPEIGRIQDLAISPDGSQVALYETAGDILVYDLASGKKIHKIRGAPGWNLELAWSPDGTRIASDQWFDEHVRINDLQTGEELLIGKDLQGAQIDWSRERDLLATGDRDGNVRLWNPVDGELIDLIGKHENEIRDLAWEPGGERIASAGGEASVRIIAVGEGANSQEITVNRNEMILALSWAPEGGKLLIHTFNWEDGSSNFYLWSGDELAPIIKSREFYTDFAWSPDGNLVALSNGEVYNAESGTMLGDLDISGEVAWSSDAKYLISTGDGLEVWGVIP